MAVLNVPGAFPTIQQAVAASAAGDLIVIASTFPGNETVSVNVENLTFSAPATVSGITLNAAGVTNIFLSGNAPINVNGDAGANLIVDNNGANVIDGGGGGDTIDVFFGGLDTLKGGDGDDIFQVAGGDAGSTADGGTGTDIVRSFDLGAYTFTSTERLETDFVSGSIAQLLSFPLITDSGNDDPAQQIGIGLRGAGGAIDFSAGLVANTRSVNVDASNATSAVTLTGTVNGDVLRGSSNFNDTVNGGGGNDTISASGGIDALNGGDGDDTFNLFIGGAGTVDGGVGGTDTVRAGDLGGYAFTNIERLETDFVSGSIAQLLSFPLITDDGNDDPAQQLDINLVGAGGTIDFSAGLVANTRSVDVSAFGATSGVTVTGTINGDVLSGSDFDDTLNGGAGNDTINAGGGIDALNGGDGNDTFNLFVGGAGTVDGGAGTNIVRAGNLGRFTFTNVQRLETDNVTASVAQLLSFAAITDNNNDNPNSTIGFNIVGPGGAVDFSTGLGGRISPTRAVDVDAFGADSAVALTGTANADFLAGSNFNDTLNGGAGNDRFFTSGGFDALNGDSGDDTFELFNGNAGGTVDGGADTDTVRAGTLTRFTFANVERLETDFVTGTLAQFNSFATITDDGNDDPNGRIGFNLVGPGGTVDFSTGLGGRLAGTYAVNFNASAADSAVAATGTANADILSGSSFDDALDGGAGNDTINTSDGVDTLSGGDGDDIFNVNGGSGTIDGGAGTNIVRAGDLGGFTFANITRLETDSVRGSIAQLLAFPVITDSGNNSPFGQIAFSLTGAGGAVDFSTGLVGTTRSVSVDASGVTSAVTVNGTANNDVLSGSGFDDTLNGGAGNDTFGTSGGVDALNGGDGDDIFNLFDGDAGGTIDGGAGTDTVRAGDLGRFTFANVERLETDDATGTVAQFSSFATITDVNDDDPTSRIDFNIVGAGGAIDFFTTRVAATRGIGIDASLATSGVTVTGTVNDDVLQGADGFNDALDGGAGNDTLTGDGGIDTLTGGAGNDVFQISQNLDIPSGGTADGGADTDIVRSGNLAGYTFTNIERLETNLVTGTVAQFSSFATITDSFNNDPASRIDFNILGAGGVLDFFTTRVAATHGIGIDASLATSAVTVTGTANDDRLQGSEFFNDVLDGAAGNDTLVASGGTDTLSGGEGNDTFELFDGDAGGTIDGGAGTDIVRAGDLGDFTFANVERLETDDATGTVAQFSSFAAITDSFNNDPASLINFSILGAGGVLDFFNTRVSGIRGIGIDASLATSGITVTGTANNDRFQGSADFNDVLDGGAGDDTLIHTGGTDTLAGGIGNDRFEIVSPEDPITGDVSSENAAGGTADGGADFDTVASNNLGTVVFTNIERLEAGIDSSIPGFPSSDSVTGTVAQFSSFAEITDEDNNDPTSRLNFNIVGAGGAIDFFTTRVASTHSIGIDASLATSGVTLTGTFRDDVLEGADGFNDTVDGGGGDDAINAAGGIDTLIGGTGDDIFTLGSFEQDLDDLFANPEPELPLGGTADGGDGDDTVVGGNLGTYTFTNIETLSGSDVTASIAQILSFESVFGLSNVELVREGGTIDFSDATRFDITPFESGFRVSAALATSGVTITGTSGVDVIEGSDFNDTLSAGSGDDTLRTQGGTDTLSGGTGDDRFEINGLENSVGGTADGGDGIDTVAGGDLGAVTFSNIERLEAENVTASIAQLLSFATIVGRAAPLGIEADNALVFNLTGAGGAIDFSDTARLASKYSVIVDAFEATAGVTVTGTGNADSFSGSIFNDVFTGGAGDDSFTSLGGTDTLSGGSGNDTFEVFGSAGSVDGGSGLDIVSSSDLGRRTFKSVEVLDTNSVRATAAQVAAFATIKDSNSTNSAIEILLRGSGGKVDIARKIGSLNTLDFSADGVSAAVSVKGTVRDDTLRGSAFDDTLDGNNGSDRLIGGLGNDIYISNGNDIIAEGIGGGTDRVMSSVTATLSRNVENLVLTGSRKIDGTGNSSINKLVGNGNANALSGGGGDDRLEGGGGKDKLTGGTGADTFVFNTKLGSSNVDHIAGFSTGQRDKIELENKFFAKLSAGDLNDSNFKDITDSGTKTDPNDFIQYNNKTGALYYDSNGGDSGGKTLFAIVDNSPVLHASDFTIV